MFRGARGLSLVGLAIAATLPLAACGGSSHPSTASSSDKVSDSVATVRAVTLNGTWPLTGEPLDSGLPNHPVYVVKIDNTSSSAPQAGLGSADMVVEELVEGGLTRLAAFYDEHTPDLVGPVRSMRASDIGIVKPMSAVLIAAGGAPPTRRRVAVAGIASLGEDSPGFERDNSRAAPYNLFAHLSRIAATPGGSWDQPLAPYFQFGHGTDFSAARRVSRIGVEFSGTHTTDWTYTKSGWTRPGSNARTGDDFATDTVLLLRVREGDAGYKDPAGNPVPETLFVGTGDAVLIHGDRALVCRWRKDGKGGPLTLSTAGGDTVEVPPGHVFVELVPKSGNVTLAQ